MNDAEKILEEVLEEKRKQGFRARVLRSQELPVLRIEIEKQEHGVSMLVPAEILLKLRGMSDAKEIRTWAEDTAQILV